MHVALVQMSATTDSAQNRQSVGRALDGFASTDGLDLVVLPEAAMHDFGKPDHDLAAAAEDLDGPFVQLLAAHAKRIGATVVAGIFERSEKTIQDGERSEKTIQDGERSEKSAAGLPYNSLVVLGPDGDLRATYRKAHLYDSFGYRESDRLSAGPVEPVLVEIGDRIVGLMTCYDLRFPEYARLLVDAGADTICVPAAWVRGALKEDHWMTLLRARAIENTVDVLGVGQCGSGYVGHTMAVDPLGVVVAAAGEQPAVVRATLSTERLAHARELNPSLANRRMNVAGSGGTS